MNYVAGGVKGKQGQTLTVQVPVKGQPAPAESKGESKASNSQGTVTQADKPSPAAKPKGDAKRLRVSAWMDHPATAMGRWIDVKTGKFQQDLSMIQNNKGALDDISFLSTIWMGKNKDVAWKVDSVPMFLQKSIDACHANGVQCIAGYSIADEGAMQGGRSKLFCDWIKNPTGPSLEQHAADIMEFLFEKKKFDVDGIGFDLELNGLHAEQADAMTQFYGKLADLLAAKNKVLTVATGIGEKASETSLLGTFRAQPFRLAKGHPNIIIRPMAYDMFRLDDGEFLQWHKDVVDYALNKVGLDPGQFQLGLKVSKNVHSQDPNFKPSPGWTETKCTFDAGGVADRCTNILKPNNVGVITFAGWNDFKRINAALNPGGAAAGAAGSPLQVPLAAALG